MDRPGGAPARRRTAMLLALLAVFAAGCRLDVTAEVAVDAGGGAVVEVAGTLDDELLAELDRLGVDPTAELAASDAAGWEITRTAEGAEGLTIGLRRELDDARQVGDALRELTASLAEGDPAIDVDVEVEVTDDEAVSVAGSAMVRPPADVGVAVDGEPLGPSSQRLAAMTADVVDARLVVSTPGGVVAHNGERVDARRVVWPLAVGEEVPVELTAASPSPLAGAWPVVGVVVGAALVVVIGVGALRRRRITRGG